MSTQRTKRLQEVEGVFRGIPIPVAAVQRAFEVFRKTGELPDDRPLTWAVATRVRTGRMPYTDIRNVDWAKVFSEPEGTRTEPIDPVLDALFEEVIWASEPYRWAARQVFLGLAASGVDPSTAKFGGMEPPAYGTVGIEAFRFPQSLVQAPYRRQATRLLRRIDRLRERIPQNRAWFAAFEQALGDFHAFGERPQDELVLEGILALGEIVALGRHAVGEDVSQWMAAFDAAARKTGAARDEAIAVLQELVVAEQNAID